KWSRENGSVAARVESISGSEITLTAPGRDQLLGFATGDWIEVTDDLHELRGEPGSLIRIIEVNDRVLTVEAATLDGPAITQTEYQLGANAKVRRWESAGAQVVRLNVDGNGVVVEDGYLPLEDGVQVRFETGTFRTGDYWVIPARTEGATVEWPADGTQPAALAPHGIEHHYCRVGLISFTRALTRIDDCRCLFQPLCACGIRVRGVTLGVSTDQTAGRLTAVALRNDTEITLNQFARGVVVECDRDIDPETVSRATCFITVEAPMVMPGQEGPAAGRIFGYQNIVLNPAIVRAEGARIFWAADPFTVLALSRALQTAAGQRAMLARLTLKGNFIQSAGSLAHLDGDTFSIRERGDRNTPLRSPSGDGRDGGDFECWFWLAQFCDETFPRGYVPFGSNIQLTAADVRGDRVVVGTMTPDSFRVTRNLRLPDFDNQAYCGPVQLAPGRFFVAYVQTALERGGNYSSFGAPLIDPLTGGQFPGNVIPANRLPGIGATAPAQAGTYAWRVREIVDAPYYPYSSADFRGIGSDLI
ncbi:MAG TPA: hypothetical protein DEH78_08010, partial [Solibacterales bacterium]|nr:hypothetical protein [Bryobacterales bacterium]